MGNIHMIPIELNNCAVLFDKQADKQVEIYDDMKDLMDELGKGWAGNAYDATLASFVEQEQILRDRTELLKQFAQLIRETRGDLERMDSDLIRSFAI